MRKLLFTVTVLYLAQILPSNVSCEYYYSSGNQISLTVDSLRMVIKFDEGPVQFGVDDLMSLYPRIIGGIDDPLPADGFFACSLSTGQASPKGDIQEIYPIISIFAIDTVIYILFTKSTTRHNFKGS